MRIFSKHIAYIATIYIKHVWWVAKYFLSENTIEKNDVQDTCFVCIKHTQYLDLVT